MVDLIDSSFTGIQVEQLVPSFFQWLFSGALGLGTNQSLAGIGLLMIVGLGSYLIFMAYGSTRSMMASSILTWIVAFLLRNYGWINNTIFFLMCVYVVTALYYLSKKSSGVEA